MPCNRLLECFRSVCQASICVQTARILGMCSSMPCYLPIWQATTPMHTDEDDTRTAWHTLFAIFQSIAQTLQLQCRPCSSCTTQHSMHSPLAISLPALLSNIKPQFCNVQSCRSVCTANPLVCNKDGHHPLRTSNQHSLAPKINISTWRRLCRALSNCSRTCQPPCLLANSPLITPTAHSKRRTAAHPPKQKPKHG